MGEAMCPPLRNPNSPVGAGPELSELRWVRDAWDYSTANLIAAATIKGFIARGERIE